MKLRANPRYELVLFDRLPASQQELLRSFQDDPEFYGVLRPRGDGAAGVKSVCRDTALLYLTLREPGRLPSYARRLCGGRCDETVAGLVLDGVLEVEADGMFVSGPEAYGLLYERPSASAAAGGAVTRLSAEALKYAQALETKDLAALSTRLYCYNRRPASPYWKQMFPTPDAVAAHLGIDSGDFAARVLERHFWIQPVSDADAPWLSWFPRYAGFSTQQSEYHYKLYISPACESLREAFQAVVEVLAGRRVLGFKVGRDVYGLLRPDKFVAYFQEFDELQSAAERLTTRLEGLAAQGVPFTAGIAPDGLLSWGTDPPAAAALAGWYGEASWRQWLTERLAAALLATKAARPADLEPWQFALERIRLEGVDPETWVPSQSIWHGPEESRR